MLESTKAHACGKGTVRRCKSTRKGPSNRVGQYCICITNLENKTALAIGNTKLLSWGRGGSVHSLNFVLFSYLYIIVVRVKRNGEELQQPVAATGKISAVLLLVYCLGLPNYSSAATLLTLLIFLIIS